MANLPKVLEQLQAQVEALFAPRSVFFATALQKLPEEQGSYRILDPGCEGLVIKNVPDDIVLGTVLGLPDVDLTAAVQQFMTPDGTAIDEAKLREGAGGSEAAFQKRLEHVRGLIQLRDYHAARLAARTQWAKETKLEITYEEYHALRQYVRNTEDVREDTTAFLEDVIKHAKQAVKRLGLRFSSSSSSPAQ
jgi:hypothetical protein